MQHPITPPPELAAEWFAEICGEPVIPLNSITLKLVERAAQWGADQELDACCALLKQQGVPTWSLLRLHRRQTPPSLKKQAWKLLETYGTSGVKLTADQCNTIRRALEALSDD